MKVVHLDHEITVKTAGRCAPTRSLWFSVFRASDGFECLSAV